MDRIQERISYIEGLAEGLDMLQNKKEGKFYSEVINILSSLNKTLQNVEARLHELEEYVEAIDEDLNDIEWDYYEGDDDDDFEFDDSDDYSLLDSDEYIIEDIYNEDDDEEIVEDLTNEDGYYQVICPSCNETVLIDHSLFETSNLEEVMCPNCHEILIIDNQEEYER